MARPASWRRWLRVDPVPWLGASSNAAIAFFARRDLLGEEGGAIATLWDRPAPRRILARQQADGSWRYPGGDERLRSRAGYDQLETFRQVGVLVEQHGLTREHHALARAARFLFAAQTAEGDFRGIYGEQYATTYVGAITELLVKAGYGDDRRVAKAFRWLLAMRQNDGGWAIPMRTLGVPFARWLDRKRYPRAAPPDREKRSSHLVTGMALRAFAAHPTKRKSPEAARAASLLAASLYRRDAYADRGDPAYWDRVSFPFWFTDVVSAIDTLSRVGVPRDTPSIAAALEHVKSLQRPDGSFAFRLLKGKDPDLPLWIALAVCRSLARWDRASIGDARSGATTMAAMRADR